MASFPARDIAARYGANPKKGKRKLGDTPIPKYPSIHSNRSERTREAVVSHFTANPAAASSVLGLRNNSAYSAQHKKNMQLKFLETSCPLHLPGGAPYLPVVKRAPPPAGLFLSSCARLLLVLNIYVRQTSAHMLLARRSSRLTASHFIYRRRGRRGPSS